MKLTILDKCTVTNGDVSLDRLATLGNVSFYDIVAPAELPRVLRDSDALVCNKAQITAEIIEQCENLKYIGLFATGYNNIDLEAADRHGITVCNVPGYSTDSVAQHVFAMILHFAVHLSDYNESVHRGDWVKSKKFSYFSYPINELSGKVLGIFGLGAIGERVAQIGNAFSMQVIACTRTPKEVTGVTQVDLDTLLERSDYLSLNCPLTDATRGLICDDTISKMKRSAVIINAARGAVIDEAALCRALNSGRIAGAGIDVLDSEPMIENHPYLTAKNCIITPHIGWAATEARVRLIDLVCENILAYLAGKPINVVNSPKKI